MYVNLVINVCVIGYRSRFGYLACWFGKFLVVMTPIPTADEVEAIATGVRTWKES